jgi:hypothetical protein
MLANEDRLPVSADRQGRAGLRLKGPLRVSRELPERRPTVARPYPGGRRATRARERGGIPTARGGAWTPVQVTAILLRVKVMHQGPPNYGASVAEGTCSLSISPGAERRRVR